MTCFARWLSIGILELRFRNKEESRKLNTWYSMDKEAVLAEQRVDALTGLGSEEIAERQAEFGLNEFTKKRNEGLAMAILRQLKDVSVAVLLVAASLSLALALKEGSGFIEPFVIISIVIMNVILAITQERGAERALEALSVLNSPYCYAIRDGIRQQIETAEIVPGDIVVMRSGDMVSADARLLEAESLAVDESSLTGESEPREKSPDTLAMASASLSDQANMIFSGCLVVGGHGKAVVTGTGMNTQIGKIAACLQQDGKSKTPLQIRLVKLGRLISAIAVVSALVLFVIGLTQKEDIWHLILVAVALAVAAVPETLALIVTLMLTHGVKKMVLKNAMIRKLQAVETLGSTSVICSDKTGTLTQNRMIIKRLWRYGEEPVSDAPSEEYLWLLKQFLLAGNAALEQSQGDDPECGRQRIVGDPAESAIMRLCLKCGINMAELDDEYERVVEIPFSSSRKMMTVVVRKPNGRYLVLCKGALDRIPIIKGDLYYQKELDDMHRSFAEDALQVIALASKEIVDLPPKEHLEELESSLIFQGFIGLLDPPRPDAAAAIARAKSAGIRTVMITGDHALTAGAVAKELGIIAAKEGIITGAELAKLTDDELFESIEFYSVYARVTALDKIRIVRAWQRKREVVSMTGDGINDAPALRAADVGVAMGINGTEVAKGASDMVLADDNFSTIVEAVTEGRNVFSNIRKLVYFLIVCNISEVVIMLFAQISRWGLPVTPVMLLLINVLGDGIPGMALAKEESDPRIMSRKPISRNESFFGGGLMEAIIIQIIAFSAVTLACFYIGKFVAVSDAYPPSEKIGQTMAFLNLGWTSILHIFTVRSRASVFKRSMSGNLQLPISAAAMFLTLGAMAAIPPAALIFGLTAMSGTHWLITLGLSFVPIIRAEYGKLWDNYKLWIAEKNRVVQQRVYRF